MEKGRGRGWRGGKSRKGDVDEEEEEEGVGVVLAEEEVAKDAGTGAACGEGGETVALTGGSTAAGGAL